MQRGVNVRRSLDNTFTRKDISNRINLYYQHSVSLDVSNVEILSRN